MALTTCEDCGRQVSTEALACPGCGRSTGRVAVGPVLACPRCGASTLVHGTGIHGAGEIAATLFLCLFALVPGLIAFAILSAQAWCSTCKRRPAQGVSPITVVIVVAALAAIAWILAFGL